MKNWVLLSAVVVLFSGCALLNKFAPSQVDEAGNAIPGTHDVIQPVKDVAHNIPYGDAAIGIFLLAWNGFEKFKRYKTEKGLMATVRAIKQASEDPELKASVDKIKEYLARAHDTSGVREDIKLLLAKI